MITTLMRTIIGLKVLFWIVVIVLAYVYSAEIGTFFSGSMARFDHLIGYGETQE